MKLPCLFHYLLVISVLRLEKKSKPPNSTLYNLKFSPFSSCPPLTSKFLSLSWLCMSPCSKSNLALLPAGVFTEPSLHQNCIMGRSEPLGQGICVCILTPALTGCANFILTSLCSADPSVKQTMKQYQAYRMVVRTELEAAWSISDPKVSAMGSRLIYHPNQGTSET